MSDLSAIFRMLGPELDRDSLTVEEAGIQFGRSNDNGLVLSSSEISRRHFRFEWQGGQIAVFDMNSSNGVYVNDERIAASTPVILRIGDAVRAGPFVFTLEQVNVPPAPVAEATAEAVAEVAEPTPKTEPPHKTDPPVADKAPDDIPEAESGENQVLDDALNDVLAQIKRGSTSTPVDEEILAAPDKPAKAGRAASTPAPGEADGVTPTVVPEGDNQSFVFQPLTPDYTPAVKPAPPAKLPPKPPAKGEDLPKPEPVKAEAPPKPATPVEVPERQKPEADGASGNGAKDGHLDDPYLRVPSSLDVLPPKAYTNGHKPAFPAGIPHDVSNWLKYLPAIYQADDFLGRYLLIFESVLSPDIWIIDNFDLYLSAELAPGEWIRWMASWFDVLIVPELPEDRQRAILSQVGWLFFRRGTRAGLERLLELYWGVRPEIVEPRGEPGHFIVRMPLSESRVKLGQDVLERLIVANKPAFSSYAIEVS